MVNFQNVGKIRMKIAWKELARFLNLPNLEYDGLELMIKTNDDNITCILKIFFNIFNFFDPKTFENS